MYRSPLERLITVAGKAAGSLLAPVERRLVRNASQFEHPPLLVVGCPRSGTTLVYQTLVNAFQIGYWSFLHDVFYEVPVLVDQIAGRRIRSGGPVPYESSYGRTPGWRGPSEGGRGFWRRWFEGPGLRADPSSENLASLRSQWCALTRSADAPFLMKNVDNSMRLDAICRVLPEAYVFVVERSSRRIALSLLRARVRVGEGLDAWFGVRPPGWERARKELDPVDQVFWQVQEVYSAIREAEARYGKERFLRIRYEEFCTDVPAQLAEIEAFAARHRVSLTRKHAVPEEFHTSGSQGSRALVPGRELRARVMSRGRVLPYEKTFDPTKSSHEGQGS